MSKILPDLGKYIRIVSIDQAHRIMEALSMREHGIVSHGYNYYMKLEWIKKHIEDNIEVIILNDPDIGYRLIGASHAIAIIKHSNYKEDTRCFAGASTVLDHLSGKVPYKHAIPKPGEYVSIEDNRQAIRLLDQIKEDDLPADLPKSIRGWIGRPIQRKQTIILWNRNGRLKINIGFLAEEYIEKYSLTEVRAC